MRVGNKSQLLGFTLIELLVTIAVLIVLVTVAAPGFKSLLRSNSVASDYNTVLVGLSYARSEAVKRREVVKAEISVSSDGWEMKVKHGESVLRSFGSSRGRVVVTEGSVDFNSLGRRSSCAFGENGCNIYISSSGIGYGLEILSSGRVVEVSDEG